MSLKHLHHSLFASLQERSKGSYSTVGPICKGGKSCGSMLTWIYLASSQAAVTEELLGKQPQK